MSFKDLYTLGTEGSTWSVKQDFDATSTGTTTTAARR